jgi:hypothetical protein
VEVTGEETIHQFRSILAYDLGLQDDFVLACRTDSLPPLDERTLNSLGIFSDMTTMSIRRKNETDVTTEYRFARPIYQPPPPPTSAFKEHDEPVLLPETITRVNPIRDAPAPPPKADDPSPAQTKKRSATTTHQKSNQDKPKKKSKKNCSVA